MNAEEVKHLINETTSAAKDISAAWEKFTPKEKEASRILIWNLVYGLPDDLCDELNNAIVARAEIIANKNKITKEGQ